MEKSYRSLHYFLLLFIPLTLTAFYKTYFNQFPHFSENNNLLIHIHATIAVVWLTMLTAQPFLISNNQYALHRKIGKWSYIVFPLFILSFIPQIVRVFMHGDPKTIFFPVADCVIMTSFYVLAMINKKDRGKHMLYMIVVAMCFLFPTMNRIGIILLGWPEAVAENVIYGAVYFILIALIWHDRRNHRIFQPYLLAFPFFMLHQLAFHLMFVFGS